MCNGRAEVWLGEPAAADATELHASLEEVLSTEERHRLGAFVFERDRTEYLFAHALLRYVLSRQADVEPRDWVFTRNEHGRPEITNDSAVRLHFSLSHTDGLVAVAVAVGQSVGVDVENTRREIDTLKLAERYFAPSEAADLRALAASSRQERFFEYWTLKEAYAKARGMGMSLPFDRFSFELTPGQPPRVSFSPALRDNAENWQFELSTPTEQHRLAVAVGPP